MNGEKGKARAKVKAKGEGKGGGRVKVRAKGKGGKGQGKGEGKGQDGDKGDEGEDGGDKSPDQKQSDDQSPARKKVQAAEEKLRVAKIPEDVMTLVPTSESGNSDVKTMDDRRVYEVISPFTATAPATQTDFEGRVLVVGANSLKITDSAATSSNTMATLVTPARVTVRWRFGRVSSATVDGASVEVKNGADGPYVEFSHAGEPGGMEVMMRARFWLVLMLAASGMCLQAQRTKSGGGATWPGMAARWQDRDTPDAQQISTANVAGLQVACTFHTHAGYAVQEFEARIV